MSVTHSENSPITAHIDNVKDSESGITCQYIYKRGENRDLPCGKPILSGSTFCGICSRRSHNIQNVEPVENKPEVVRSPTKVATKVQSYKIFELPKITTHIPVDSDDDTSISDEEIVQARKFKAVNYENGYYSELRFNFIICQWNAFIEVVGRIPRSGPVCGMRSLTPREILIAEALGLRHIESSSDSSEESGSSADDISCPVGLIPYGCGKFMTFGTNFIVEVSDGVDGYKVIGRIAKSGPNMGFMRPLTSREEKIAKKIGYAI